MTKNEAIDLAIKLITENKLQYYLDNLEYLAEFGKQRMSEYEQAINILQGLKDGQKK